MKTLLKIMSLLVVPALILALQACSEDEMEVPAASTQAAFDYAFEVLTDEETGEIFYEVSFENKSLKAVGYHWDFGDGNTSDEKHPVAIYQEDGVYEVTLTVEPERELHYNKLEATERLSLVSTLFRERFDDPALEEDFPPEGWTLIDLNGDGNNWYWDSFEGDDETEYYIMSDSWDAATGEVLEPDNWIVTPKIDLSEQEEVMLEFYVTPRASGPEFRTEKYSVLVSTTGTDVDDFETIYSERLDPEMENWVWLLRSLDLAEFAGEEIHVAFRHHDSTDLYSIVLTDIHLFIGSP